MVSKKVSKETRNVMNSAGMKIGWTYEMRGNFRCEYVLLWLEPFFGSEGWGFESLRARQYLA